jgi:hypothetical protein
MVAWGRSSAAKDPANYPAFERLASRSILYIMTVTGYIYR